MFYTESFCTYSVWSFESCVYFNINLQENGNAITPLTILMNSYLTFNTWKVWNKLWKIVRLYKKKMKFEQFVSLWAIKSTELFYALNHMWNVNYGIWKSQDIVSFRRVYMVQFIYLIYTKINQAIDSLPAKFVLSFVWDNL